MDKGGFESRVPARVSEKGQSGLREQEALGRLKLKGTGGTKGATKKDRMGWEQRNVGCRRWRKAKKQNKVRDKNSAIDLFTFQMQIWV